MVITQSIADKLFPGGDAVGQVLTMNGARYQVVGVYAPIKSPLLTSLGGSDYIGDPVHDVLSRGKRAAR